MKNVWLAPGSAGSPGPTARSNGDVTDATWWNYLGDDDRAWGGDVSAEGHNLSNVGNLYVVSGGKVGIGTASPFAYLSAVGGSQPAVNASAGGAAVGVYATASGQLEDALLFGVHSGDYGWIQSIKPGTAVRFLCLNPNGGSVGIGTTAPTSALQVVGLPTYASDAAAGSAGLTAGAFWKDSSGGLHVKL